MHKEEFIEELLKLEEKYLREKGHRSAVIRKIVALVDEVYDNDSQKNEGWEF